MTTRTYNGVPETELDELFVLKDELYSQSRGDRDSVHTYNMLRGILNIISMCFGNEATLDLVKPYKYL